MTSLRNVGLVIATSAFPGSAAVTAVTAYGIVEILGSPRLAVAWGRLAAPSEPPGVVDQVLVPGGKVGRPLS